VLIAVVPFPSFPARSCVRLLDLQDVRSLAENKNARMEAGVETKWKVRGK